MKRPMIPRARVRVLYCSGVIAAGWFAAAAHAADPAPREDEDSWQVAVTVGKDGWLLYHNPRFGCVLPVPPGMRPLRPPDNGDGQAFVSADGKVKLSASGGFNIDNTGDVAVCWNNALAEPERTITYKRKCQQARLTGLEPVTFRLEGGCSIQLSYRRIIDLQELTTN